MDTKNFQILIDALKPVPFNVTVEPDHTFGCEEHDLEHDLGAFSIWAQVQATYMVDPEDREFFASSILVNDITIYDAEGSELELTPEQYLQIETQFVNETQIH